MEQENRTLPDGQAEREETDAIRNSLIHSEKGCVANTLQNCKTALEQDPLLRGAIRRNLLTGQTDLVRPVPWPRCGSMLTDTDQKYIELRLENCYSLTSEKKIAKAISIVANEHRYHPVADYLESLSWDGVPRIGSALHHFLGAEESAFNGECLRVFMSGAVKRVFEPGCKFDQMLCLVGGQGAGKSSFFRLLAVRDEWFSDDLKKLDDENIYRKMQGHWIIEMSEMIATASAKSIEEIKSFLSRQKETYKVPYEVHPEDRPRQCVFAGTTNRLDFLPRDRTGNRRFLPVPVFPELAEQHPLEDEEAAREYVDQLWAEIMVQYRTGTLSLLLSPEAEKELRGRQRDFMQEDARAGMIRAYIQDYKGDYLCSRQLFREAYKKDGEPEDWETREICEIVNTGIAAGDIPGWRQFRHPRRFAAYGTQRGWERIIPVNNPETEQLAFLPVETPKGFPW